MAHMIDMTGNRANMAYVGTKPWHGLGQELTEGASLDQWRVEAGLNWEARRNGLYYRNQDQVICKSESEVIYRDDTGAELGIVSPSYKIVQPAEVMEFFRDLTTRQGFTMETAGSLDGGRKVWALARTGQDFRIMGQDQVKAYVLLATSFDGTLSTRAQFTSVRVVCNNTLSIARAEKGGIAIPHSTSFDASQVKVNLGLLESAFSEFEENAGILARRKVAKKEAVQFILDVLADGVKAEEVEQKLSTRKANIVESVFQLYNGKGMGSRYAAADGTAWGLVNAVTEYVDHVQGNNENNRFRSAQFGIGADLKREAFNAARKLAA